MNKVMNVHGDEKFNQNEKTRFQKMSSDVRTNWDKYVYTGCILYIYLNFGINNNLFPPAMVDMKFLFRTSMEQLNYAPTLGVIGYLCGSLCGFLYKYLNRQLTFAVMVTVMGVFIGMLPLAQELWQFYAYYFLWYMGGAAFDSGNAVWTVEMWKERSPPVLQLAQMMYGVGSIVGPFLIQPFIVGDLSNTTDPFTNGNITLIQLNTSIGSLVNDPNYSIDRRPKLMIPFLTAGGLTLICPVILFAMFFVKRYRVPVRDLQGGHELDNFDKNFWQIEHGQSGRTRNMLIALMAMILMSQFGLEVTFMLYSSTYFQSLPIRVSAPKAAEMMSVMWTTYTIGRGVSVLIAAKLRAEIMLTYHLVIIGVSLVILSFGQHSEILIYAAMITIGFGFSAMWPACFALAEKHIRLTDKINSIFAFVSALLMLISPPIISPKIEKTPKIFLIVELAYFSIAVVLFLSIILVIKISRKFEKYRINSN